jgi:predicted dehydrogenase
VAAIERLIEAGELGEILHIESNFSGNAANRYAVDHWRVAPGESPAGGMAGAGIHMIDAIIHLAGPITGVTAMSSRRVLDVPLDDTTAVIFTLASGASASLTTIMATASTFRIQVFGSRGSVELRGSTRLEITSLEGTTKIEEFPPVDIERAELEAFAESITGDAAYPVSAAEVLNGIAAFEAVSRSAAGGTHVAIN